MSSVSSSENVSPDNDAEWSNKFLERSIRQGSSSMVPKSWQGWSKVLYC